MTLPTNRAIMIAMLRAAQGKGATPGVLYDLLSFEFSFRNGHMEKATKEERELFTRSVSKAEGALLAAGLIAVGPDSLCKTTVLGEAYLKGQCDRISLETTTRPAEGHPSSETPKPKTEEGAEDKDDADLGTLLGEAGFCYQQRSARYFMTLAGKLRPWYVLATASNGWLSLQTDIFQLPEIRLVSAKLLETVMQMNQRLSAVKFGISGKYLCLGLEYRMEHVDANTLAHLVGTLTHNADRVFADLVRIVTGDAALSSLEAAYKKSA